MKFLTVQHLWSHPVRVAHHCVALFAVNATEYPLLVGGLVGRGLLHLVLHDEPGQAEVRHHHRVVLMSKCPIHGYYNFYRMLGFCFLFVSN